MVLLSEASATETENLGIRVLPAPGEVTVDGKIDDWDLSGGIFACKDIENQRDEYACWLHVMYDADNLYILARWIDGTPMNNPGTNGWGRGWEGDSLQARFVTAPGKPGEYTTHITGWLNNAEGKHVIDVTYGKRFDDGSIADVLQAGARQAFLKNKDGKGYSQEIALPWRLLTKDGAPLKAGDEFTLTAELNFCHKERGRVSVRDIFEPEVWIDRRWTHTASHCWGSAALEPKGNVPPRPVRLSDGREAAVQMKDGVPVVDWATLPEKKAPPAGAPDGAKPRLTVRAAPLTLVKMRGDKSGFTPLSSDCDWHQQVGLMAPNRARIEGTDYEFVRWEIDGTPRPPGRNSIKITMDKDRVATAVYQMVGGEAGAALSDEQAVAPDDNEPEASAKPGIRDAPPLVARAPGFVGYKVGHGWDIFLIGLLVAVLASFGLMLWRAGGA